MVQLQDSILECLHHHTLSNMLSNEISEAHYAQILSCSSLGADIWLIVRLVFLAFWLSSLVFFTTLHMWLGLPHPSIAGILQCVCTHPISPMGIHFLCCAHGAHDVIHDTFAAIVWDASFHVEQEQLHVLLSTTFNSFCRRIDIVLTKESIRTLVNIVIIDLTQVNLLP